MSDRTSGVRSRPVDDKVDVRDELDLAGAHWRGDESADGERVEMAEIAHTDGVTYTCMRHSDDPHGPVLVFTPGEWTAFVAGALDGEFDKPY